MMRRRFSLSGIILTGRHIALHLAQIIKILPARCRIARIPAHRRHIDAGRGGMDSHGGYIYRIISHQGRSAQAA